MAHYLSNRANRNHKALFGNDAFFDLDQAGSQARFHTRFSKGDFCVVLSEPDKGMVRLAWHRFTGFRDAMDERGKQVRVLVGPFVKEESMPKGKAAGHRLYHPFFNKNGDFKRGSVF